MTTNSDKSLANVFGVDPIHPDKPAENLPAVAAANAGALVETNTDAEQIDEDTEFVKHKLKSMLETGNSALEHIALVAKSEESPRAFEVVSTLMGQLKDIAMGILDAEGKRQKLKAGLGEQPAQTIHNTQNNTTVFVGTTAELQQMLDDEPDDVIDVETKEKKDDE